MSQPWLQGFTQDSQAKADHSSPKEFLTSGNAKCGYIIMEPYLVEQKPAWQGK